MSAVVLGSRIRMMTAANRCAHATGTKVRRLHFPRWFSVKGSSILPMVFRITKHLWVVLSVAGRQRDRLEVKLCI